jgi:pilus assembly protein Flp/PilA
MLDLFVDLVSRISARSRVMDENGATAVEYALMVGLIAVGIIAAVVTLKDKVSSTFQSVGNAVGSSN